MRQVTIADIHTRLRGLQSISQSSNNRVFIESAQTVINSKRIADIKRFIEGSVRSNSNIPFYIYTQLFETVVNNGSISDISTIGDYIAENAVPKVRDAKSTNSLIKRRLTIMSHKSTNPISSAIEDAMSALQVKAPASPTPTVSTNSDSKEEVATEAYIKMLEKSIIMNHCDRVIENYNKISKRFNLDRLFIENTSINGVGDTVIDLCNKIDTYDMPNTIKFNTVIETAWYGFESNSISYNKNEILEAAVDYFMFKPDGLESCKKILEATLFYDKNEDMGNLDILTEEEPEETVNESINDAILNAYATRTVIPVNENSSFKELFEKFKKEELPKTDKPESKIRSLINKLYSKDVDSIIDGTPDLLQWFRRFFIVGTCAIPVIGPVLMGVGFIADKFISIHKDREEIPKMIKCFNNEIKASKNKRKSTEDSEEKEKLDKYIKNLEQARDKLESYYNDLLTDEEQDKRFEEMDDNGEEGDLFDDDFDLDDFLENSAIGNLSKSIDNIVSVCESNIINPTSMYHLVGKASDDDIIYIAKLAARYPETFYKESVVDAINDNAYNIRKGKITCPSIVAKATRLSALDNANNIIRIMYNNTAYTNTLYEAMFELDIISEAYTAISIMIDTYNNQNKLLEASITNTLNVASMKLKNAITKMSDKERSVSRSLDVGMNNFKKGIERALTNDNRESIIKGSVLPSFSKIIKMCIMNAGLIVFGKEIGLVTAIIGTLGYFAVNAKFKAKERQMVIDEIEIELDMCERYINLAEQKNDMKALRQLLTTKRELERQRQRIKYKMKVDFGQKYYDTNTSK